MAKLTTAQAKQLIVEFVKNNLDYVAAQFVLEPGQTPSTKEELLQMASNVKDWKRRGKRFGFIRANTWCRDFDCTPFDDQLRAYVTTDAKDEVVLSIDVCGE